MSVERNHRSIIGRVRHMKSGSKPASSRSIMIEHCLKTGWLEEVVEENGEK